MNGPVDYQLDFFDGFWMFERTVWSWKVSGYSDEIMEKLEKADEAGDDVLEETKLKRMILNFEKKIAKNQELRIKFPDDPAKFMSSEVELHDAVQEMRVVATAPDLYPIFVDMECVATLLGNFVT